MKFVGKSMRWFDVLPTDNYQSDGHYIATDKSWYIIIVSFEKFHKYPESVCTISTFLCLYRGTLHHGIFKYIFDFEKHLKDLFKEIATAVHSQLVLHLCSLFIIIIFLK